MAIIKSCLVCNKNFTVYPSQEKIVNKIYCSRACKNIALGINTPKICPICGAAFTNSKNKTCSLECSFELKGNPYSFDKKFLADFIKQHVKIDTLKQCWVCTLRSSCERYCKMGIQRRRYYVHRIAAYVWLDFDLSSELMVLHHCDNPPCCNPDHLFIGTRSDNMKDAISKERLKYGNTNVPKKLSNQQAVEIRQSSKTSAELAIMYNVSEGTIRDVKNNKTHRITQIGNIQARSLDSL